MISQDPDLQWSMYFYDYILTMLGLKKRKSPARENWIEYASFSKELPVRFFSDSNFFLLFMLFLSYFYYPFFLAVTLICYYRVLQFVGRTADRRFEKDYDAQTIVYAIQCNHNETLKRRLMEHPALIDCVYQKKTLLSWTKHYKNLEAHRIILQLTKEKILQKK